MNELSTQKLIYRAGRWPWRWFRGFRQAAAICEQEICKFTVLNEQHKLTVIEASELRKQRLDDTQKIQELRDEYQLAKFQIGQLDQQLRQSEQQHLANVEHLKLLTMELNALREEKSKLIEDNAKLTKDLYNAKDGTITLYETIRRMRVVDSNGKMLPELRQ